MVPFSSDVNPRCSLPKASSVGIRHERSMVNVIYMNVVHELAMWTLLACSSHVNYIDKHKGTLSAHQQEPSGQLVYNMLAHTRTESSLSGAD